MRRWPHSSVTDLLASFRNQVFNVSLHLLRGHRGLKALFLWRSTGAIREGGADTVYAFPIVHGVAKRSGGMAHACTLASWLVL